MSRRDDIRAALDDRWRSARDIWERVGQWAPVGIRSTLGEMAKAGEIDSKPEPMNNGSIGYRMLYRRKIA